jgi:nucleoid-associated protein YgaU
MADRYKTIQQFKDDLGRRYYTNPIYPDVPVTENDTYVITTAGDRYDLLAQQFYGDSTLWWVIASANVDVSKTDGMATTPGIQLRIPANAQQVVFNYQEVNEKR